MANHIVTTVDEMTITTRHNVMAILGSFAKDIFKYNRWLSDPFCRVKLRSMPSRGRKFWSQVGCNVSSPHSDVTRSCHPHDYHHQRHYRHLDG